MPAKTAAFETLSEKRDALVPTVVGSLIVGYKPGKATADITAYGNGGTSSASASITNATIRLRAPH